MNYATLDEVKGFLGISGNDQDTQIEEAIAIACTIADGMLRLEGPNALEKGVKTQLTEPSGIINLSYFPVDKTAEVKINGVVETGALYDGCFMPDIWDCSRPLVEVQYTAGYPTTADVPLDIKYAVSLIIAKQIGIDVASDPEKRVVKYEIGHELIEYARPTDTEGHPLSYETILERRSRLTHI